MADPPSPPASGPPPAPAGWTTTRAAPAGDPAGHYTNSCGGTSIRDLVVRLLPPAALAGLKGKDPSGTWTLEVSDTARADRGSLRLEMGF